MVSKENQELEASREAVGSRKYSNIESVNFNEMAGKEIITFLPKMMVTSPK